MGKSSSSIKKKRSKKSSKAKASGRSKSKKYKSKKVRRREVSLSTSDSESLDISASSSSEDRYKRKRDRSRTRKDVKVRKKRARKRSRSCDSGSEDSIDARKEKKRKRAKKDDKVKEKPFEKKKRRREASVSSMRSGSLSCSTCEGGVAGNDDGQYEADRGRSERKEKDKRRLRGRSGSEKSNRYRARSFSPCSPRNEDSYYEGTEENYLRENKSRWLRSVITVTTEAEESRDLCGNETTEEIVDYHDYPCRSNDSNDGGTKREFDHHTLPESEEKLRVEDEVGDMNADLIVTESKLGDSLAGTSESMKNETSETSGANLNGDDLESILRQKALENLKKFRGEIQSDAKASHQKNKIVSQVKQQITDNIDEPVQGKSNVINAAVGSTFDKQTPVEETSLPSWRRNLVSPRRNVERILNTDKDISGSAKHQLACAPEKVIDADNPNKTVAKSTNYRKGNLELTSLQLRNDSLQSRSSLKQTTVSGLPQEKLVLEESTKDKGASGAADIESHSSNDNVNNITGLYSAVPKPSTLGPKFKHNNLSMGRGDVKDHSQFELKQTVASHEPSKVKYAVTETDEKRNAANSSGRDVKELDNAAAPESCVESTSVENISGKSQDESNEASQFEQKTMNVMRGGEMVQVSYKVYIPKKAPALARRQLKR
ncbi:uncharacterized protein LOC130746780 [Lotus japonicus]|uniref:uncharacterized protein LOC130746780 n=1 Tax=Lotus japonicus TaxID=34305 RepID=UPI002589A8FF|nr:uncharacterized protein LOC130746780 [Lotus japonicus]